MIKEREVDEKSMKGRIRAHFVAGQPMLDYVRQEQKRNARLAKGGGGLAYARLEEGDREDGSSDANVISDFSSINKTGS